jgi:tape measure domain-containing protein
VAVSVVDIQVNSQGAVRNLRKLDAASQSSERSVNGLTAGVNALNAAIAPLLAAFSVIQAAKFVFVKTAELETQTRSIQVLTGSVAKAKQIISELQAIGAVTPLTSTELIDTAKRLSGFGVAANDVVDTTRRLGDVAGATGANLGELSLAYGRVIAKGRLQGEELLRFQERGVALQDELRKMYGLTGEEFSKALSKGQISAQAVEVALQRLTNTGGKYANGAIAQSDTLSGRLSTLQNGVKQLARTIGVVLAPELKKILTLAIQDLDAINAVLAAGRGGAITRNLAGARASMRIGATSESIDRVERGIGQISGQRNKAGIQQNIQALREYQSVLQMVGPNDPNADRAVQLQGVIFKKINENIAAQKQFNATRANVVKPIGVPALLGETGGKSGGGAKKDTTAEKAANAAAKESERVAQVIRDRLAEGQLLQVKSKVQDKISAAEISGDKMLAVRLQGLQKEIDIQYQYAQALAKEKKIRVQEAIIFEGNTKLVANQRDTERELAAIQRQNEQDRLQAITAYLEKQYELNTAIQQQNALAESVSSTLGQGMTSVFDALIQGSDNWGKSLQQIASKVLVDIANQLIRIYVIEQAVSAIKSFLSPALPFGGGSGQIGGVGTLGPNYGIKQFAAGGTPPVGRPSLVGERGPELFMPGVRGSIIPNNALGGGSTNVVVNVDASGSSVQGDERQGAALGQAISAAVQAELVRQQRPGGLLAGTR